MTSPSFFAKYGGIVGVALTIAIVALWSERCRTPHHDDAAPGERMTLHGTLQGPVDRRSPSGAECAAWASWVEVTDAFSHHTAQTVCSASDWRDLSVVTPMGTTHVDPEIAARDGSVNLSVVSAGEGHECPLPGSAAVLQTFALSIRGPVAGTAAIPLSVRRSCDSGYVHVGADGPIERYVDPTLLRYVEVCIMAGAQVTLDACGTSEAVTKCEGPLGAELLVHGR